MSSLIDGPKTKGLPTATSAVALEVDWGLGYELVLGLRMLVDAGEEETSYAEGQEWFASVRALLGADLTSTIERYSGGHEILFGYLLALAAEADEPRDAAAFLDAVRAIDPLDLRTLLLGGRLSTYRGRVPLEVIEDAALGDEVAERTLLAGCLEWQRAPYEHVLSLEPDECKRLLEAACEGWLEHVLRPRGRETARVLRRSARAIGALTDRLRPDELVDTATKGVRYSPESGIERVLLVPHLVSRPWSIFTESGATKIVCYGVDESLVTGDAPPDPLVAAYKALGDETRLRIVRRLAEGPATLSELTELTGLAKSTVHGHLLVLRTGGLVVVDESRKTGYALRRETLAESAALLETYLEAREE